MMMRKTLFIAPLCACAIAARCADNDETKFKPQFYKPGKETRAKAYVEKPYTVPEKAPAKMAGGAPLAPAPVRQPEVKPLVSKEASGGKPLEAAPPLQGDPFSQWDPFTPGDKLSYPSTIRPSKTAVAERRPFVVTTNRVKNAVFVPAEKPKEKNPILEPRQGIKILPTDDNR